MIGAATTASCSILSEQNDSERALSVSWKCASDVNHHENSKCIAGISGNLIRKSTAMWNPLGVSVPRMNQC